MRSTYFQEQPRRMIWIAITISLLIGYFGGIAYAAYYNFKLQEHVSPQTRASLALIVVALALVPKLYWWWQDLSFQEWLTRQEHSTKEQNEQVEFERERFHLNRDNAMAVWTALIIAFSVLVLAVKLA